ncbi:MAG: porin, partial [Octadecabacter sp.]|nr:porin [Octadecabacter sp.]
MKSILLSSAAIIGLAGAAAAEAHTGVSFSGVASLGYNDTDNLANTDDNIGFYSDLEVTIGFAAELDNGLTAAASIDLEDLIGAGSGEEGLDTRVDYELSLTSETTGLYYGDTQFAAERMWVSAGDMEGDSFSEADGEEVIRGEVTMYGVEAQVSYVLADADGVRNVADDLNQLSIGLSADFGNVNVVAAYQEESGEAAGFYAANGDFNDAEAFGISVGTSFAGADIRLAYADDTAADSIGVKVSYPVGPVTATAYYVSESVGDDNYGLNLAYENGPIAVALDYQDDQGTQKVGLEGSYDVGNGLTVFAGVYDDSVGTDTYVAAEYDLGSGASLLVSYADANSVDALADDEV